MEKYLITEETKERLEKENEFLDSLEIKPCPFCGKKAVLERDPSGTFDVYFVACLYCEIRTGGGSVSSILQSKEDIIQQVKLWNARV